MVMDTAKELALQLRQSEEFRTYLAAGEALEGNETAREMLREYHRLQLRVQAVVLEGRQDEELFARFQKLGEVLQMEKDTADYLMAELRVNKLLGDVYKLLAEAVQIDLTAITG